MKMARRAKTTKQHNISLRMATSVGDHLYSWNKAGMQNHVKYVLKKIADQGTFPPSNFRWAQTGKDILDSYERTFVWFLWQGYPSFHNQEPSNSPHWVTPSWWRRDTASHGRLFNSMHIYDLVHEPLQSPRYRNPAGWLKSIGLVCELAGPYVKSKDAHLKPHLCLSHGG